MSYSKNQDQEKICQECLKVGVYRPAEEHHIIFRSKAAYMVNVEINKKQLCQEHHRGNNSPHMNRKIDLQYKLELQKKLFEIFSKPFYSEKEIQALLDISEMETKVIVKVLRRYKEGFDRVDIVVRLMGGKLYAE